MAATRMVRDFYKVLIISQPGKGKTYSFINMDREKTGYINPEHKPLPFEGNFKYHARPKRFGGVMQALQDYIKNPEIEVVVLDGFNMALDMLVEEMRTNFRGFDIWSNYNIRVAEFIKLIKQAEKEIFVTGHYEILNIEGEPEKRLKVLGKEHEGRIEAHFTVVLYADGRIKDNKPDFFFKTTGEGLSAKCPPAIFGEGVFRVPNDSKLVLDKIVEFAKKSQREEREDIFA